MIRIIIILLAVLIILTIIKRIIRRFTFTAGTYNVPDKKQEIKNEKDKDDDNISDAKFEEIK